MATENETRGDTGPWESIEHVGRWSTERMRVQGGWLYRTATTDCSESIAFVADRTRATLLAILLMAVLAVAFVMN